MIFPKQMSKNKQTAMKPLYRLTKLTPREAMDSYPGPDLPIRGGWGYNKEDACIIDKNDPIIDPDSSMPFYGIGYEKIFVERRIYMELITYRMEDERYSGIEWKMQEQKLIHLDDKPHDLLKYEVTGFKESDWKSLKEEWETSGPELDRVEHLHKREELKQNFEMEFWFEISSFYGQFF